MPKKYFLLDPAAKETISLNGERYSYRIRICRTDEECKSAEDAGYSLGIQNAIAALAEDNGQEKPRRGRKPKQVVVDDDANG